MTARASSMAHQWKRQTRVQELEKSRHKWPQHEKRTEQSLLSSEHRDSHYYRNEGHLASDGVASITQWLCDSPVSNLDCCKLRVTSHSLTASPACFFFPLSSIGKWSRASGKREKVHRLVLNLGLSHSVSVREENFGLVLLQSIVDSYSLSPLAFLSVHLLRVLFSPSLLHSFSFSFALLASLLRLLSLCAIVFYSIHERTDLAALSLVSRSFS